MRRCVRGRVVGSLHTNRGRVKLDSRKSGHDEATPNFSDRDETP